MRWLRNLGLNIKLTLLILIVFGLFFISNVVLLVYSTQSFTSEIGNERIEDATTIIQNSLSAIQTQLSADIDALVTDIAFFQAVGRRDSERVAELLARANIDQTVYDVQVVDGDGNLLFGVSTDEDAVLLPQNLREDTNLHLNIDQNETGQVITISDAAQVVSVTGNVLGALHLSRQIDQDFLDTLIGEQRRVLLGLIYEGAFISQTSPMPNLQFDANALTQTDITPIDSFNANNTPYIGAYLPVMLDQSRTPLTLLVLVELSELYNFQNTILNNTVIVFVLLMTLTTALIYVVLYQLVIKPILRLRATAQHMTGGEYGQRIPVISQDELGQLAQTFNTMAEAVQQREDSLTIARQTAERSDQVKSAFLASMSHELRTPLNAVINFTKFVAKGDLGPVNEEQKETLYEVVGSAKHLLNLINDVLDMSKIESGSLNLFVVDNVDVSAIIQQVSNTSKVLLEDKPVKIETHISPDLPLIRADRQRLTQILLNILSNACKFTDEGAITIRAHRQHEDVVISVTDTGPGIAPEDQSAVFEAFKQTTTGLRQGGGTGLGMPITKSLVEAHGGNLQLISQVNEGATFTVTLPITSPNLAPIAMKQRS